MFTVGATQMSRGFAVSLLTPIVLLVACGASLSSAKSDFKSGRVAEAKDTLVTLEPESKAWTGSKRAEYVLYRGLVHHSLGDREEAAHWLRQAKAIAESDPKTYSEDDRARLDLALDAIGP
jgi:hypothetical protein